MDLRRRHARASDSKSRLLHALALSMRALPTRKRSLMATAVHRRMERLHLLELFGDKVALRRECLAAESRAHHFVDTLCDSRLPIHQNAQVVSVEHEQARSRDGGHRR